MTDHDFIQIWREKATTQDVADAIGSTHAATSQRASRLRKKGYDLPRKYLPTEHYQKIGALGGRPRKARA